MTLRKIEEALRASGVENYKTEARLLVECFLNIPSARLVAMKDEILPITAELETAIDRRMKREPLQYILGKWSFMNETYAVTQDVLVPRPDTEVLVEYGIDNLPQGGCFADLCTGSGCVSVSLLAQRKDAFGVAVEKYPKTLEVARKNAEINGVSQRFEFILGDVTEDVFEKNVLFDAVLSNPPYVSLEEYASLGEEEKREPRHALTDEKDGLSIIKSILDIYPRHIKKGGFLAIEIGYRQGGDVRAEAEKRNLSCEILPDIEGRDRLCVIKITGVEDEKDY